MPSWTQNGFGRYQRWGHSTLPWTCVFNDSQATCELCICLIISLHKIAEWSLCSTIYLSHTCLPWLAVTQSHVFTPDYHCTNPAANHESVCKISQNFGSASMANCWVTCSLLGWSVVQNFQYLMKVSGGNIGSTTIWLPCQSVYRSPQATGPLFTHWYINPGSGH